VGRLDVRVRTWLYHPGNGRDFVVIGDGVHVLVRDEADARLIAAAPDLLEALKWLLDNGEDPHPLTGRDPTVRREDIGPARDAIAKAEGGKE
jgi:hypothetical protein